MSKVINILGECFGRLTVMERDGSNKRGLAMWVCKCSCGNTVTCVGSRLITGRQKSCGCLSKEAGIKNVIGNGLRHGNSKHPLYNQWFAMMEKCSNPRNSSYANFGGKGIKVCKEWHDFKIFAEDMQERPTNHVLDRADRSLGYSKDNCFWTTRKEFAKRQNQGK